MKTFFIVALAALLPNLAFAGSVQCNTLGADRQGNQTMGISLTFSSESNLLSDENIVTLESLPIGTLFRAVAKRENKSLGGILTLSLQKLVPGTDDVDPNGLRGRVTIGTRGSYNSTQPVAASGAGNLHIDNPAKVQGVTIFSVYDLSDCIGDL